MKKDLSGLEFPPGKLPPTKPKPPPKPKPKTERELLERLVEQGNTQIALLGQIKGELANMANEVVTQVNAKLDTIEQTLRDEAAEIQAAIEAAGAGGATEEELSALNARLDGLNTAIEALVVTPSTEEPPSE
jgi:vacuolar-type H+-ATPase subunit I/STV1